MSEVVLFIAVCTVLTLIAIAIVVVPLLRGSRDIAEEEARRHQEVLGILRQQRDELERDHERGLVDIDEYEESKAEIERRVIEETKDRAVMVTGPNRTSQVLAGLFTILIPVFSVLAYLAWGRFTAMDPRFLELMENHRLQQEMGSAQSVKSVQIEIDAQKARLKENPNDGQAWYTLAVIYAQMQRPDESVKAFKELNRLYPDNADLLAQMADQMASATAGVVTPEVVTVLEKALRIDPNQQTALLLMALNAWDRERYLDAVRYWERVLVQIPPNMTEERAQIENNIREAKRLGGEADKTSMNSAQPSADNLAPVPTEKALPDVEIAGRVVLAEGLKGKVSPDDVVFVYARPQDEKMPVAFMRIKASDLPYAFKLTQKTTMGIGLKKTLRDYDTVVVGARLSHQGNFMLQPGDLEGEVDHPVKVGTTDVTVTIAHER